MKILVTIIVLFVTTSAYANYDQECSDARERMARGRGDLTTERILRECDGIPQKEDDPSNNRYTTRQLPAKTRARDTGN